MPKTVTLRLNDDEYAQIVASAKKEGRTLSGYLRHIALKAPLEPLIAPKTPIIVQSPAQTQIEP